MPENVESIKTVLAVRNITNVSVQQMAVSEKTGMSEFHIYESKGHNSLGRVKTSSKFVKAIQVPTITLDEFTRKNGIDRIDFLKIDVEGFELFVLRGASCVLARTDMVYFESWESHFNKFGYSTPDVLTLLADHGFDAGVPKDYKSSSCENLLAVNRTSGRSLSTN